MQVRKPIKRKIKRKKPGTGPSNMYFTEDTQNAIIEWQKEPDPIFKQKIYKERIHPAFDALVDNLINVNGYKANMEQKEDLKNECLSFLSGVIGKYDHEKGFRAFAYFNIVAKHWLTIRCKKAAKEVTRMVSLDNPDAWTDKNPELILGISTLDHLESNSVVKLTKEQLEFIINEVKTLLRSESHKRVLDAALVILEQPDELDFMNKRGISTYLRNLTGLTQKEISTALSAIKKKYRIVKYQMEEREEV